jgi:hypothetical protein
VCATPSSEDDEEMVVKRRVMAVESDNANVVVS